MSAVATRARPDRRPWTEQEDSYLLTYSSPPYSFSYRQLGEDIGRTSCSVRFRLSAIRRIRLRERRVPQENLRAWMVDELSAHITAQSGIDIAKLEAVKRNLAALRDAPKRYWQDRAAKPLIEWFREVGAA